MMPDIYLTPASICYLTQVFLSTLITIMLAMRYYTRADRSTRSLMLTLFFGTISILLGLFFLDSASLYKNRLSALYLENPVLALALVFLLQFAYRFPMLQIRRKWEAYLVLAINLGYLLWEAGYTLIRFFWLQQGHVLARSPLSYFLLTLLTLWVLLVFGYRYAVFTTSTTRGLREMLAGLLSKKPNTPSFQQLFFSLVHPQSLEARASGMFVLISIFLLALANLDMLQSYYQLSSSFGSTWLSLGILAALFIFSMTYLNYQPEGVSFMVKLSGTSLAVGLALLGSVGWAIAPAYERLYQPGLTSSRSLRFSPNPGGGYDISLIPYSMNPPPDSSARLIPDPKNGCSRLDFEFSYYGQKYPRLYACQDGYISLGQPVAIDDIELTYSEGVPLILPLLTELAPDVKDGGVTAWTEKDRLVISWEQLSASLRPPGGYSFQVILYSAGYFDFNYNEMPSVAALTYKANDNPDENIWALGALPGRTALQQAPRLVNFNNLPFTSGSEGFVQDYYLDFRQHLHALYLPLAWLVLLGGAIISLGIPFLVYYNLVKPLNLLLRGVRQMDAGNLETQVVVSYNDEIGYLTQSFNKMTAWLHTLVTTLEQRVAERTQALAETNDKLQKEMIELEAAQEEVLAQQKQLATLEEREILSRDLHDGVGQVLAAISIQAQTVKNLLERGELDASEINLEKLIEVAQEANVNIRSYILGLQSASAAREDFFETLKKSLDSFKQETGIQTSLNLPRDAGMLVFPASVEDQLLHIIQEALANTRKHASASKVEVFFSSDLRATQVIISDDGQGFNTGQPVDTNLHFGLGMIRDRAKLLGGRLDIRSAPGAGTKVLVSIPRLNELVSEEDLMQSIYGKRVLLVDDSPIFLEGMHNLLMARGLSVIGQALDGLEALEKARQLHPDLIVMDVMMPNCNGLEATRLIKAEFPEIKIVMLTISETDDNLFEAIKSGASGYLLKNLDANQFCQLLASVVRGHSPITPELASRLLDQFAGDKTSALKRASDDELNTRQWQILELVAHGMAYKEVAQTLKLKEATIKYHMAQILERLHLENRADAVAYAKRRLQGK